MKTYLADIFPKIQRYSEKLDNLALLINQHWVSIDTSISKTVYIFRTNNELIISTNGKVEKAEWEFLGNKSLLIDKATGSYLFKHGFFDENILALKVDSTEEYAVFINEDKYDGELNSIESVIDFLNQKYLNPHLLSNIENVTGHNFHNPVKEIKLVQHQTDKGILEILPCINFKGQNAYIDGQPAPDGIYNMGLFSTITIKNGIIVKG